MKLSELKTIKLTTMTPIFIGSGEVVKPLSYVIDGSIVHVVDPDQFLTSLTEQEQQQFLSWIDPLLTRLADLDAKMAQARENEELKRQLRRERRDLEAQLALEQFLTQRLRAQPAAFVRSRNCTAYSVKWIAKPESQGFHTQLKAAGYRPYLPGTELKGAIRTSLIHALLQDNRHYESLKQQVVDLQKKLRSGEAPKRKVEALEGIAKELEANLLRGAKDDAKFDLLKFVQISDTPPVPIAALEIHAVQSLGTRRPTRTLLEVIRKGMETTFKLAVAEGFQRETRWVLNQLGLGGKEAAEWLTLPKLLEACYQRSRDILAAEARYSEYPPAIQSQIQTLQQQNRPETPLLRLGMGQGFLSITVDLHVKTRDPQLYDRAIREGVTLQRRNWRTQPGNFPKTRRVMTDQRGTPTSLLGWVKLEVL